MDTSSGFYSKVQVKEPHVNLKLNYRNYRYVRK